MTLGSLARYAAEAFGLPKARHFESIEPLLEAVEPLATSGATLLIKGSRFMKMERIIAALTGTAATRH